MEKQKKLPEQIKLTQKTVKRILDKTSVSDIEYSVGENYYPWYLKREKVFIPKSSLTQEGEEITLARDRLTEMNSRPIYK